MRRNLSWMTCLFVLTLPLWALAQGSDPQPTPDSLQVERLNLEIERLKLENQRLQLEIKTLQLGGATSQAVAGTSPAPAPNKGDAKSEAKQFALDMANKSEALAKDNAANEHMVVLDFSNGEIWYKGVRTKMNDFAALCSDENWKVKPDFIKYDINGDSMNRYKHLNLYMDRYIMQSRGVFYYEAPATDEDFTFVTPETVTNMSKFSDFRNHFETAYFTFDKEYREKTNNILRFKRPTGFLGFDDVLEVWFDSHRNFVRFKWGMLDKK